jgi:hypothetical protein
VKTVRVVDIDVGRIDDLIDYTLSHQRGGFGANEYSVLYQFTVTARHAGELAKSTTP